VGKIFTNLSRSFPKYEDGAWFYYTSGSNFDAFRSAAVMTEFLEIPELNSVINWKASAFRNMKIDLVNDKGDIVKENVSLFSRPNYYQGKGEFLRQTKLFHEIFGNEYLYLLAGLSKPSIENVKSVFTMPPSMIEHKTAFSKFWTLTEEPKTSFKIKWGNEKYDLDQAKMIHFNDNRVNIKETDTENYMRGTSKIESLKPVLSNIRAAYQARGTNLTESGPRGILTNGTRDGMGATVPLDPSEKEKIQNEMKKYGSQNGQHRNIITNLALDWKPMGFSTVHMRAFEEVTEDNNRVCDEFGISIDVFSRGKGSTYENKIQAERGAYQNTIIPEAVEWIDGFNHKLGLVEAGRRLRVDYSHLAIFSKDRQAVANAMKSAVEALDKAYASKVITIDEYREELKKYMK